MPKRTRKSYTAETKLKILAFAEIHGYRAAGREFDCDDKSIREWRNDKEVLKVLPKNKRARRGRSALWPEIEDHLKTWIIEKRSKDVNRRVNTIDIRLEAMKFANQNQILNFKGTPKWCYNFMKRHNCSGIVFLLKITKGSHLFPSVVMQRTTVKLLFSAPFVDIFMCFDPLKSTV